MTFWHNHNNKSYPAHKMLPREMLWCVPNPMIPWPEYAKLLWKRRQRGSAYFEERIGSRGGRAVVKKFHTRKSRQWNKRQTEVAMQDICDA